MRFFFHIPVALVFPIVKWITKSAEPLLHNTIAPSPKAIGSKESAYKSLLKSWAFSYDNISYLTPTTFGVILIREK